MKLYVESSKEALGSAAAALIARRLSEAAAERGSARLVLSTGMSQFETLEALVRCSVPWERVTMFHLDEYIGIPDTHAASFRKYLKERFVSKVPLGEAVFVDVEGDVEERIARLTARLREAPVDVGVIGIGENAHIAFNDPPADFQSREAYWRVTLNETCRMQQVGEGWFPTEADVPREAVSMTPYQIMCCKCIVSPVPRAVKAQAIAKVLSAQEADPMVPATLLKTHGDYHLFLDQDSASACPPEVLERYRREA